MDDPNPIEAGVEGTVYHVGGGVMNVNWDNGRDLGLVMGGWEFLDDYEFVDQDQMWEEIRLEVMNDSDGELNEDEINREADEIYLKRYGHVY
jgi:hypothetical protein